MCAMGQPYVAKMLGSRAREDTSLCYEMFLVLLLIIIIIIITSTISMAP